ncbi:MAG: hypothetical protein ACE5HP_06415 [Gemmatimonadota bacterium]
MRNVSLFPVALLLLASPLLAQVDVQYDADAGVTTVSIPPVGTGRDAFTLKASFECPGEELCVPAAIQLVFASWNRRPRYRANHEVTLVLDKETEIRDLNARHLEKAARGMYRGMNEYIVCEPPTDEFLSIAAAKRVDYRIGSTKGRLGKEQLAALAALAERIPATGES